MLEFLTPDVWDFLVWMAVVVGIVWAVVRLWHDLNGPPLYEDNGGESEAGGYE